jgi:hypothetical protein
MLFQKSKSILLVMILQFGLSMPNLLAAPAGNDTQAGGDDIDTRITRLTRRINFGVKQGTIQQDQADKLQSDLKDIGMQAEASRKSNGGSLNPTDRAGLESRLNQKFNIIQSYNQAGARKTVDSSASGPAWAKGEDGAQDARALKRRMKLQEQRQLRQEEQAMMQVREQQQQQYEKEMLQKLGSQRPTILQNKQDIDQIRQNTGAN